MTKNIFCINGHGKEEYMPFHQRELVPKDTVLVLFGPTASEIMSETFCKFMDFFRDEKNRNILSNPQNKKNVKILRHLVNEKYIRIYTEGYRIPFLVTDLNLKFEDKENIEDEPYVYYQKSGIFRFPNIPIIPKEFRYMSNDDLSACDNYDISSKLPLGKIHELMFEGNINSEFYTKNPSTLPFRFHNKQYVKVSEIIKTIPGVYYYGGCRWIPTTPVNIEKILKEMHELIHHINEVNYQYKKTKEEAKSLKRIIGREYMTTRNFRYIKDFIILAKCLLKPENLHIPIQLNKKQKLLDFLTMVESDIMRTELFNTSLFDKSDDQQKEFNSSSSMNSSTSMSMSKSRSLSQSRSRSRN